VRIQPVRQDRAGREVDLDGILTALEQTSLKDLGDAVKAKHADRFADAYQKQLTTCVACHKAAGREMIRLKIPDRPAAAIIDFTPEPDLPPRKSRTTIPAIK
jgi:hypothetical protein